MKKLNTKGYDLREQKTRISINCCIDEMKKRDVFTADTVRRFLMNQIDSTYESNPDTYSGLTLTYGQALGYYNEIIK